MKDAIAKGEHLDDLIDKEMIDLLGICKRLHCPHLNSLQSKFVYFGAKPENKRLLILDMDETMLHARFLSSK